MKSGSNRVFGILIALVFCIIAAFSYRQDGELYPYLLIMAGVCLVVAVTMPRLFSPLTRLWLKLGTFLHGIVGPVMLGLVYLVAILPTALAIRLFRKDLLSLKLDRAVTSYWVRREQPLIRTESLRDQF